MRITLRELARSDSALVVKWRNRWDVRRWFWDTRKTTIRKQEAWFDQYWRESLEYRWIIEVDGIPAGSVGFGPRMANGSGVSIYIGEPGFRRKGVAKKALRLAMNDGVHLGLHYYTAEIKPGNKASVALFASCGFKMKRRDDEMVVMEGEAE
jgi:RimJ/RimL family protein N-acetyltransferase